MNTSTDKSYQDFLLAIAKRVDSLSIENPSAIVRFRKHLQSFADGENRHLEWLKKEEKKCFKKGMTFTIRSGMEVPREYECPGRMFVIDCATKNYPAPRSKAEELQRNYIILASIHDHKLTQVERIDNSILPDQPSFLIWTTLDKFCDSSPQRVFIEQALKRVEADLARPNGKDKQEEGPLFGFKEGAERIRRKRAEGEQDRADDVPTLTEDEVAVLDYLNKEHPQIRFQQDILSACGRDRKTVKTILDKLMACALVSRPEGKQRGYVITTQGRKYLEDHFCA